MYYIGVCGSGTPNHIETSQLASINLLLVGFPKYWMVYPCSKARKFAESIHKKKLQLNMCPNVINCKDGKICNSCKCPLGALHSPGFYTNEIFNDSNDLNPIYFTQQEQDLVYIAPGCIHSVVNDGANIAIAKNLLPVILQRQMDKSLMCECPENEGGRDLLKTNTTSKHRFILSIDKSVFCKKTCTGCKGLTQWSSREEKLKHQSSLRANIFPCEHCKKTFTTKQALNGHISGIHFQETVTCVCKKVIKKAGIRQHKSKCAMLQKNGNKNKEN